MVRTIAFALLVATSCAASFLPSRSVSYWGPSPLGAHRRLSSAPATLAFGSSETIDTEHERSVVTNQRWNSVRPTFAHALVSASLAAMLLAAAPTIAHADGQTKEFKFPPIDFSDEQRCVLKSSSMGQANAARDALFDLRQCQLVGVKATGFDLSGAGTCPC